MPVQPIQAPSVTGKVVAIPGVQFHAALKPHHGFLGQITVIQAFLRHIVLAPFLALHSQGLANRISGFPVPWLGGESLFQ